MKPKQIKLMAIVGGSAPIALGVVGVTMNQESPTLEPVAAPSGPTIGATVTQSAAPTTLATSFVVPALRGPAPLPPEEQGVPG
jgi:hypothetical protein